MSVLDGFKEVGERTGGKLTMTVMLESVRFSKGVSEVLGRPEFVKLLVNYERGKFAIQVCDENDDFDCTRCPEEGCIRGWKVVYGCVR